MTRYMAQDLFATLVVKLAWLRRLHQHDASRQKLAIDAALLKYRSFYTHDHFEDDLWPTVDAFDRWLVQAYPNPPEQMAWMNALHAGLGNFEASGARKRVPLFSGLWYASARTAPSHRAQTCLQDIARCYRALQTGEIPF